MLLAKIVGTVVATRKDPRLVSSKLLVVRQADAQGNATGPAFLAVDLVGSGEDELVIVSQGSSARMACAGVLGSDRSPADAAIIGILDSVRYYGEQAFTKS